MFLEGTWPQDILYEETNIDEVILSVLGLIDILGDLFFIDFPKLKFMDS